MIKPKTRKEKLLSAIANDTPVPIKPKNREELFLAQIAEKTSNVPKPLPYDYMPEGYPHYKVELQTVLEESVTTTALSNGLNRGPMNQYDESVGFEVGKTYDVIYDGVTYTCTAYGFDGMDSYPCVGNSSLGIINGAVTEEPFLIVLLGSKYLVHYTAEPGEHTCVLKEHVNVPVPMDKKFLPADIGGGVTSWNDLTDKPFGKKTFCSEFYLDTRVSNKHGQNEDFGFGSYFNHVTDGTRYYVRIDGIVYMVLGNTYYGNETFTCVGNPNLYDDSWYDEGSYYEEEYGQLPFCFVNGVGVIFNDDSVHNVVFGLVEDIYYTIKENYIPDTIQRVGDDVLLFSPNGSRYKLTVADDGTLAAVNT